MSIFDEMLKNKEYQSLLNKLPEDEKKAIMESLRRVAEDFENQIIKPIKRHGLTKKNS
jgi:hypothetical protein